MATPKNLVELGIEVDGNAIDKFKEWNLAAKKVFKTLDGLPKNINKISKSNKTALTAQVKQARAFDEHLRPAA